MMSMVPTDTVYVSEMSKYISFLNSFVLPVQVLLPDVHCFLPFPSHQQGLVFAQQCVFLLSPLVSIVSAVGPVQVLEVA